MHLVSRFSRFKACTIPYVTWVSLLWIECAISAFVSLQTKQKTKENHSVWASTSDPQKRVSKQNATKSIIHTMQLNNIYFEYELKKGQIHCLLFLFYFYSFQTFFSSSCHRCDAISFAFSNFHSIRSFQYKKWVNSTRKNFHIQNSRNEIWLWTDIASVKCDHDSAKFQMHEIRICGFFLSMFVVLVSRAYEAKPEMIKTIRFERRILNCMNVMLTFLTTIASVSWCGMGVSRLYQLHFGFAGVVDFKFFFLLCDCIRIDHLVLGIYV